MVAFHNVRYEVERMAVCEALYEEGLGTLALKRASLVPLYPDYSMREVGDNDVLCGMVGRDGSGAYRDRSGELGGAPLRERVSRVMGLGYGPTRGRPSGTWASTRSRGCT